MEPVAIRSIGPVTGNGVGYEELVDGLCEGITPARTVPEPLAELIGPVQTIELVDFDVADFIPSKNTYLDPGTEIALAATALAFEAAGIDPQEDNLHNTGLSTGSAFGAHTTALAYYTDLYHKGPRRVKPLLFPNAYSNTAASHTAIQFGLAGPHLNFASGNTASATAILECMRWINAGKCQNCVALGYEVLTPLLLQCLEAKGQLTLDHGSPFSTEKDGLLPATGSTALLLQSEKQLLADNATALARIRSATFGRYRTTEDLTTLMESALIKAGCGKREKLVVLANANGIETLDLMELSALEQLAIHREGVLPTTSVKHLVGETFGAAATLQLASAAIMLNENILPALPQADKRDGVLLPGVPHTDLKFETVLVNVIDPVGYSACFVLD